MHWQGCKYNKSLHFYRYERGLMDSAILEQTLTFRNNWHHRSQPRQHRPGRPPLPIRSGLTLTVAHYPTGASKWNPIEHRLFSEISKNWAGEPLDSYQKILNFIRSTRTQTGLSVTPQLDRRHYPTGIEPTPEQIESLQLKPHEVLPKWNYTISPNL